MTEEISAAEPPSPIIVLSWQRSLLPHHPLLDELTHDESDEA
jgi:hypothetical protein